MIGRSTRAQQLGGTPTPQQMGGTQNHIATKRNTNAMTTRGTRPW